MFELSAAILPQPRSTFLTSLPLEIREEIYRTYLSTFETFYGSPYIDKDVYFLPALTGAREPYNIKGHYYQEILQVGGTCRQIYSELTGLILREHAYLVDPDIEDQDWFERRKRYIRKAAITFSVQIGVGKADLAKYRIRRLAEAFEGGQHLNELGIHVWGRWRDAADAEGILQVIGESFQVPRVWVVDNHVLFGAQFFSNEQLGALKDAIEGTRRVSSDDWTAINGRALQRIEQMEKEADEDPAKYRLRKPQHSREASVQQEEQKATDAK